MDEDRPRTPGGDTPACPICNDTGFVFVSQQGRSAARPCRCRRETLKEARLRAAQIPPRYKHCTFSSFELGPWLTDQIRYAHKLARKVVDDFPSSQFPRGLLLWGRSGVGKTHLAVAVLRALIEDYAAFGLFTEFTDLLRRLQDSYDRRSDTPSYAVLGPPLEAQVLVLDDLACTTRMTPWAQDMMGLILNERYNRSLLTIVTTNRRPEASEPARSQDEGSSPGPAPLEAVIGPRLYSRLIEMCRIVDMTGEDFRRVARSKSAPEL